MTDVKKGDYVGSPRSSKVRMVHMDRRIVAYQITDDELDSLQSFDSVINISISAMTFCISMIFGAIWDIGFSPPSPRGKGFFTEWIAFWIVLLVISSIITYVVWIKRNSLTNKIRKSSEGTP